MTEIFALTVVVAAVIVQMIFTVTAPRVVLEEFVPMPGIPARGVSVTPARKIRTAVLSRRVSPAQVMVSTVMGRRSVTAAGPVYTRAAPAPMQPVLKGMISVPVALENSVMTVTSAMEGKRV